MPPQPAPAAVADHPSRRVRCRRGLTLAVLADLAVLSVPFLSMVENGQRALARRDHVNALAAVLRVAPAEIAPSTLPGSDEWGPLPPATTSLFPAIGDEMVAARHRDLAAELTGYVIRGDRYAARVWLRRLARDPEVSPWLLLDQLITRETGLSGPRPLRGSGTRLVSAGGTGRGRAG